MLASKQSAYLERKIANVRNNCYVNPANIQDEIYKTKVLKEV
jgi:hypothetical protein